ncbi:uncharacterized protein A4U43_C09F13540 [Asparagus officinalis]|uniref:Uncharacterized protein n=1 Tax=Asparagus officinalis TaxID=4686 RepID=A0A5P1EC46_ASPOF|nr:uncharacterized protein A4U43_C09F13540 [Asparagus officinalis]
MKKSEAAIHILPEKDVARYVHEEIKQKPTQMEAKIEEHEDVTAEKSLGKKRIEAYEKLVMLNEAYEQELVARDINTMTIKAETEKRFAEQKHIRQKKGELKEVKVAEEVPKKKKGRKKREGSDDTFKAFVQGLRAKSQRTTKKAKFLESHFQTKMPKKKRKGKKCVVVVEDDDDNGEKDEKKPLAISYLDMIVAYMHIFHQGHPRGNEGNEHRSLAQGVAYATGRTCCSNHM